MKNAQAVSFVRGVFVMLCAVVIGVLGVTGSTGFLLYLVAHAISSAILLAVMKMSPGKYFAQQSIVGFLASGVGDNIILFIFVWTFAYSIVYLY